MRERENVKQLNADDYKPRQSKRIAASDTSRESFKGYRANRQGNNEFVLVYRAIADNQPLTRRAIKKLTGIELSNLCRVLYDATGTADPLVKISHRDRCPITGKTVFWYSLIDYVHKEAE